MFRIPSVRLSTYVVSKIEPALHRFAEGRLLNEELVCEFVSNQKPAIKSIQDLIFMHRLAQAHVRTPVEEIKTYLYSATDQLSESLPNIATGHLSVLCSCLADSPFQNTTLLRQTISEILGRTEEQIAPRMIARMCKGLLKLSTSKKEEVSEIVDRLQTLVDSIPAIDLHVTDILNLASAGNQINLRPNVVKHAETLVPFMSDAQARKALQLFGKIQGAESVIVDIKRNLIRSRPRRAKSMEVEGAGLPEVGKAPHFQYVRKIDLR